MGRCKGTILGEQLPLKNGDLPVLLSEPEM
jgi:hypothetical protein